MAQRYKASLESRVTRPKSSSEFKFMAATSTKAALDDPRRAVAEAKDKAFCRGCQQKGHFDEDCWKQGNAPMPEHVKKRKAAQQKQKDDQKRTKTDSVPAKAGFLDDSEEIIYACPAMLGPSCSSKQPVDDAYAYATPDVIDGFYHYLDSGAARHLSGHKESFLFMKNLDYPVTVSGVAGRTTVTLQGTMRLKLSVNNEVRVLNISNILYVPGLPFSLLSVKAFGRKGMRSIFDEKDCQLERKDTNQTVAVGISSGATDLYRLVLADEKTPSGTHFDAYHAVVKGDDSPKDIEPSTDDDSKPQIKPKSIDIVTAHRRLGHLSEGHLRRLPSVSKGLIFTGIFQFCEECALAKQTRRNFTSRPKRTKIRLGRIHMDVSGPHPVSARGERYFLLILDEATQKR